MDEALKEIKGYQRAHPDDVRGYSMEGDFYGGQQKWREAEAAFRVAQKRAPDDGLIMVKLYTTMTNGGKPTAADAGGGQVDARSSEGRRAAHLPR